MSAKQAQKEITVVAEHGDDLPAQQEQRSSPLVSVLNVLVSRPDLDIDRIEKMIDLQLKVEANEARKAYFAAMSELQADLPTVIKLGKITADDKKPGALAGAKVTRSTYAKFEDVLESTRPALTKHGFVGTFRIDDRAIQGRIVVTFKLAHRLGHVEETSLSLAIGDAPGMNNAQGWGSSISYGRRYTYLAMLNIATKDEDNDAQTAESGLLSDEQQERLKDLCEQTNTNLPTFLKIAKAQSFDAIKVGSFEVLEQLLAVKLRRPQ